MKKLLILALLSAICSIKYDEAIRISSWKIYTSPQSFNKRTFSLTIYSYDNCKFIDISNYYGKTTVLKGDTAIVVLDGDETYRIFKYEEDEYYIIFEFPSLFKTCGFSVEKVNNEYFLLDSNLKLYYIKQKTFTFKIKNDQSKPKFVPISFSNSSNYWASNVTIEENGKIFSPIYYYETSSFNYLFIVKDEITVTFTANNNIGNYIIFWGISPKSISDITPISNNYTSLYYMPLLKFYSIQYLPDFPYIEISVKKDTDLIYYKNNNEIYKLESITEFLCEREISYFLLNNVNIIGFFSIIYKRDKKNSINEATDFILTLFDSRYYYMTILNSLSKTITITFGKNNIFSLDKLYLGDSEKNINPYFVDRNNKYNYIFKRELNETKLEFYFKNISTETVPKIFFNVEFSYIPSNYEIEEIEDDIFKCVDFELLSIIKPKKDKKIIIIDSNTTNSYLNGYNLNYHRTNNLTKNYYLETIGKSGKYPYCFNIHYCGDEYYEIQIDEKINFIVLNNKQVFKYKVSNLESYNVVRVKFETKYNNIKFKREDEEYDNDKGFAIKSQGNECKFEISVALIDEHLIDDFSINCTIEGIISEKYNGTIATSIVFGFFSIFLFAIYFCASYKHFRDEINLFGRLKYLYLRKV